MRPNAVGPYSQAVEIKAHCIFPGSYPSILQPDNSGRGNQGSRPAGDEEYISDP
jgi:hypothetical protein